MSRSGRRANEADLESWTPDHVEDRGVLTVGESGGFIANDGVIGLKLDGENLRIERNTTSADFGVQPEFGWVGRLNAHWPSPLN